MVPAIFTSSLLKGFCLAAGRALGGTFKAEASLQLGHNKKLGHAKSERRHKHDGQNEWQPGTDSPARGRRWRSFGWTFSPGRFAVVSHKNPRS